MFEPSPKAAAQINRRPIRARDTRWAVATARLLTGWGVSPNAISVASVVLAAGAGAALAGSAHVETLTSRALLCLAVVAGVQLRLLCNLIDGMVAVEGGLGTKTGELFNEFPDRLSDIFVLVGAGYAAGPYGPPLGWAAALLAVLTAYVRALAGAAGVAQPFCGPMAKQQRMAVITLACVLSVAEGSLTGTRAVMPAALGVIALGSAATIVRRLRRTAAEMRLR
jgi:phosphatidylglycerophosphate synthase